MTSAAEREVGYTNTRASHPAAAPTMPPSSSQNSTWIRRASSAGTGSRSRQSTYFGQAVNWPFFGPVATWQWPFASLFTAGAIAAVAAVGHLAKWPFASRQGAASAGAVRTAAAVKAASSFMVISPDSIGGGWHGRISTERHITWPA